MLSAICFNFDQSSGNGLTQLDIKTLLELKARADKT